MNEQKVPKKRRVSYISTGLSDLDKDYVSLQDIRAIADSNPTMTAAELVDEAARQVDTDKLKRMEKEAAKYASEDDEYE